MNESLKEDRTSHLNSMHGWIVQWLTFKLINHKLKERKVKNQELKRSQNDGHTQTNGNCIEIFRQARPSFSIERE
jgi:hypothetical protein